jgi:hypothetical protein
MTTAGRVPLLAPGEDTTFMPTVSSAETKLRQDSFTVAFPVKLVIAEFTMGLIISTRALKAEVARGSLTTTTLERPELFWDENPSARVRYASGVSRNKTAITFTTPALAIQLFAKTAPLFQNQRQLINFEIQFGAFLDTLRREC